MTFHEPGSAACRDVFGRLSDYLDEELDSDRFRRVTEHLDDCPPCQAFCESLRRTIALLGTVDDPSLEQGLRRRLAEDYRALRRRLDGSKRSR